MQEFTLYYKSLIQRIESQAVPIVAVEVSRTKENLAALKIQYEHKLQRLTAQEARCQDVDRQRVLHDLVMSGQDRLDLLKAEVCFVFRRRQVSICVSF